MEVLQASLQELIEQNKKLVRTCRKQKRIIYDGAVGKEILDRFNGQRKKILLRSFVKQRQMSNSMKVWTAFKVWHKNKHSNVRKIFANRFLEEKEEQMDLPKKVKIVSTLKIRKVNEAKGENGANDFMNFDLLQLQELCAKLYGQLNRDNRKPMVKENKYNKTCSCKVKRIPMVDTNAIQNQELQKRKQLEKTFTQRIQNYQVLNKQLKASSLSLKQKLQTVEQALQKSKQTCQHLQNIVKAKNNEIRTIQAQSRHENATLSEKLSVQSKPKQNNIATNNPLKNEINVSSQNLAILSPPTRIAPPVKVLVAPSDIDLGISTISVDDLTNIEFNTETLDHSLNLESPPSSPTSTNQLPLQAKHKPNLKVEIPHTSSPKKKYAPGLYAVSMCITFLTRMKRRIKNKAHKLLQTNPSGQRKLKTNAIFVREVTVESLQEDISLQEGSQKSPETLEMLAHALKKVSLLGPISKEGRRKAAHAMIKVQYSLGDNVIQQGDLGENLYVVESGMLDVLVDNAKVAELSSGGSFGELALFFGARRNATVIATTTCLLWCLDRKTYRNMLAQQSEKSNSEIREALQKVELLSSLSVDQITKISDAVTVKNFKSGETIFLKGDESDQFYIIKGGKCSVITENDPGADIVLHQGDCFGERGLLNDEPRSATIIALSNVSCLVLQKKAFNDILGSLADIMTRKTIVDSLKAISLFKDVGTAHLQTIAQTSARVSFNTGEIIVQESEEATSMYLLMSGNVSVSKNDEKSKSSVPFMELDPGAYFGEGALLGVHTRTATVSAMNDVECICINCDTLLAIMGPFKEKLFRGIIHRSLESIPNFSGYSQKMLREISSSFEMLSFNKGDQVIGMGDEAKYLYIVCNGHMQGSSDQKTTTNYFAHDYFGLEMFDGGTYPQSVVACGQVPCGRLPLHSYLEICKRSPDAEEYLADEEDGNSDDYYNQMLAKPLPGKNIKTCDIEILSALGKGSFGQVNLVRTKKDQKYFAMKILNIAKVEEQKQQENTQNEARLLNYLSHPMVVSLVQTMRDKNNLYILLEYLEGGELLTAMDRCAAGIMTPETCRFYVANAVICLEYLHKHNIAYRDLKPENLAISKDGYLKVIDFGFAKMMKPDDRTYTLCGTPEYLAPEVILGTGHSHSVDFWSLGILMYDMLCGCTPFADHKHNDHMTVWKKVIKGKFKFPSLCSADGNVKDLIHKLLSVNSFKRIGNLQGGIKDIKTHEWFKELNFEDIKNKTLQAPWLPSVQEHSKNSNFNCTSDQPCTLEDDDYEDGAWFSSF